MEHLCPHCGGILSGSREDTKRKDVSEMIYDYKHGSTLQEIGDKFGLSRERIRQLINKKNGEKIFGGVKLKAMVNSAHRQIAIKSKKEGRIARVYGCTVEAFDEINFPYSPSNRKSPATRYREQKASAKNRGIEFNLTLLEWWTIWQESGHWQERGRGEGYCMTRAGDTGPYEVGNVEIKTIGENFSDSYMKHSAAARRIVTKNKKQIGKEQ